MPSTNCRRSRPAATSCSPATLARARRPSPASSARSTARSTSWRRAIWSRPTGPTSCAGFVGQTAVKTKAVLESALGGTVLIDEAYALARGGENDFGREAIDTLVKFMEDHRDDLAVVVAGYPAEMQEFIDTNPGLAEPLRAHARVPRLHDRRVGADLRLDVGRAGVPPRPEAHTRLVEVIEAEPRGRGFGNAPVRAQRVRAGGVDAGGAPGRRRRADQGAADCARRRRHRPRLTHHALCQRMRGATAYVLTQRSGGLASGAHGVPGPLLHASHGEGDPVMADRGRRRRGGLDARRRRRADASVVVGLVVYGLIVVSAMPKGRPKIVIDPFVLSEPWRQLVQGSQSAQRKLRATVDAAADGPLRDRLRAISAPARSRPRTGVGDREARRRDR